MKLRDLLLIGCLLVTFTALGADRTVVHLEASIKPYHVDLTVLPDGGCSVIAYATITRSDGGITSEASNNGVPVEVAGVNRTDCLNIVNVRALALFKSANGF